ncbi:hypothetical protein DPMN_071907, partial [Dreissena polymorpha]
NRCRFNQYAISAVCPNCKVEDETVEHFLLHCSALEQIISIKLLTKFDEDRLQLLTKCVTMLNIKLLTKFEEDRMKTT